jgi:hypothetical protein
MADFKVFSDVLFSKETNEIPEKILSAFINVISIPIKNMFYNLKFVQNEYSRNHGFAVCKRMFYRVLALCC